MAYPSISEETQQRMVRSYTAGDPVLEIAARYGVSIGAVYRALARHNVPLRRKWATSINILDVPDKVIPTLQPTYEALQSHILSVELPLNSGDAETLRTVQSTQILIAYNAGWPIKVIRDTFKIGNSRLYILIGRTGTRMRFG